MKNALTWLISVIILVVLAAYSFCFQVRYDQVAILTTFAKATPPTKDAAGNVVDPGSLCLEPGLYPKWPWPVQQVTLYDKRDQVFETQLEELQTQDHYALTVRMFVVWHVNDPLNFFIQLQSFKNAEDNVLRLQVRNLQMLITQHNFDDLVNTDPSKLQFKQIEDGYQQQLQQHVDKYHYGITIDRVGIRKVALPTQITTKVFDRMIKSRDALAQQARSAGTAQAAGITSDAAAARTRILAFAESRALGIRTEGELAAAEQYKVFAKNPTLAIFLRQIETLKKILPHNTTFILNADQLESLKILNTEPAPAAQPPKAK